MQLSNLKTYLDCLTSCVPYKHGHLDHSSHDLRDHLLDQSQIGGCQGCILVNQNGHWCLYLFLLLFLGAVSLCCVLCVHEIAGARDQKPNVDIGMRSSKPKIKDS